MFQDEGSRVNGVGWGVISSIASYNLENEMNPSYKMSF